MLKIIDFRELILLELIKIQGKETLRRAHETFYKR